MRPLRNRYAVDQRLGPPFHLRSDLLTHRHGGVIGDLCEHAVAAIRGVEVVVGSEVDEELGVAVVWHVMVRDRYRPFSVGENDARRRLVHRQVPEVMRAVRPIQPRLDHEIGAVKRHAVEKLRCRALCDVAAGDGRRVWAEDKPDGPRSRGQDQRGHCRSVEHGHAG
eukprot:CAMPEP_0180142490 /NCGR_PEP_ID=MMETSP0986-20121125/15603_1 /TAXON_ID=697907 /ORGANISM="non described non described, Strain CCMP2293" /LENGTH=166 /DNA_ID=CAMNT_0022085681 /DNA_START=103 /DNA_END=599 /DNA_ORIENTATION=+